MSQSNNPIRYSDLIEPDDSIEKLIKQLEQMNDTYGNTLKDMRREAAMLASTLKKVSGATEEGRQTTIKVATEADRLKKAVREVVLAESDNARILSELNLRKKEANELNRLTARLNSSAEGSYNRLSAQYSINKIYLNNMTQSEREATEEGRQLEKQTREIYEEMKRLQEATGKFQLNVGNYAEAAKGLGTQIEQNTRQLALMRLEGQQGTEEYRKLAQETAVLKDAVVDASKEIKNMSSYTSNLDSALSMLGGVSGGFAAVTGAMELVGVESDNVEEAQRKLQATIALTNGVQQIQTNLQKQSALMLGIVKVQTYAAAKAEEYATIAKKGGTVATIAATVAQKAFNLVAKANPYVLLATAIISVVGALYLFTKRSKEATDEEKRRKQVMKDMLDLRNAGNKAEAQAQVKINILTNVIHDNNRSLRDRRSAIEELKKIVPKYTATIDKEGRVTRENTKAVNDYVKAIRKRAIAQAAMAKMEKLGEELFVWQESRGRRQGAVNKRLKRIQEKRATLSTEDQKKFDEYVNGVSNYVIKTGKKVKGDGDWKKLANEIGEATRWVNEADKKIGELNNSMNSFANTAKKMSVDLYKDGVVEEEPEKEEVSSSSSSSSSKPIDDTLSLVRQSEREKIEAMEEGFEKQKQLIEHEYAWEIAELRKRLAEDKNLTEKGREAISNIIINKEIQKNNEIAELEKKYNDDIRKDNEEAQRKLQESREKQLSHEKETLERRLSLVKKGTVEELKLRLAVLAVEEKIEKAKNEALPKDEQIDPNLISAGYDRKRFDVFKDMMPGFIKSNEDSDDNRLKELGEYSKNVEDIIAGIESGEISATPENLQLFKDGLAGINGEIDKLNTGKMKKALGDALGLLDGMDIDFKNPMASTKAMTQAIFDLMNAFKRGDFKDKMAAIGASISIVTSALSQLSEARIKEAEAAEEQARRDVEAAQSTLDKELEARNNGYAHNVAQAQKDLELARKTEEKAMRDKRKAQKQQAAIETLEQIGHLVTASALMWKQLGVAAPPMIAVMWASFAASKLMAAKLAKADNSSSESYGDGTVELLSGGSHQSGNDVDLGMKADGTRRRAEGGEFFAVINKRSSRKYRDIIPDVINSLNRGVFENYMNSFNLNGINLHIGNSVSGPDEDLKRDVREIREQNRHRFYVQDGYVIEKYKNLTRRYKIK